jgi:hypothetical protein
MVTLGVVVWKLIREMGNTMIKEEFLTLRWNNILTLGFGLIMLTYVGFVISTSALSDVIVFIGLVHIGAVY